MFNLYPIDLPRGGPWLCPTPRFPVSLPCSGLWSYSSCPLGCRSVSLRCAAGRSGSRRWARLCQCCAGGTPALPGGLPPMTPGYQGHHIADAFGRLVIEAGPSLFVFIRVHWWFVFKNDRLFLPRMIRPVVAGGGPACLKQMKKDKRKRVIHEGTRRTTKGH